MNEHHKGGDVGIDISITWCKSGKWIVRENKYCNKKVCKLDLQKFNWWYICEQYVLMLYDLVAFVDIWLLKSNSAL